MTSGSGTGSTTACRTSSPRTPSPSKLKWNLREAGFYAQDKWTVNRWTMNYALRMDTYATTFPATPPGPRDAAAEP